jgi:hypothetical protein
MAGRPSALRALAPFLDRSLGACPARVPDHVCQVLDDDQEMLHDDIALWAVH